MPRKYPAPPRIPFRGSTGEEGHFPFRVRSNGAAKQEISVNIDDSSQFLSKLRSRGSIGRFFICSDASRKYSPPDRQRNAVRKNRVFTVPVPGSKSVTNRALLLAVLAQGKSLTEISCFAAPFDLTRNGKCPSSPVQVISAPSSLKLRSRGSIGRLKQ